MSERITSWRASGLTWWPLGVAALVVDQLTKLLIQSKLQFHESVYVLPVLDIVHAHNYGAAWSFLDIPGGKQRWIFTAFALAVTVGLLIALRRSARNLQRLQNAGLMLIVSGALGNAIDRMRIGYVVDFVNVHWHASYFPAFNVADSCISVGAGLILLDALLGWQRDRRVTQGKVE